MLGTMIPKSGGEFVYLLEALGGPGAFLCSWTPVALLRPSQTAIIALAFGQYVAEPFFLSAVHESGFRATRPECVSKVIKRCGLFVTIFLRVSCDIVTERQTGTLGTDFLIVYDR